MLLRSSKGVMKRPKHSSSNNDETKQDLLSKLPDALLTHILSLLPDADVCRTTVLSNRWRDLWMFLPNLHFVMPLCWSNYEDNELYDMVDEVKTPVCWSMEEVDKFYDFVDKTLALRDGMPIQRFFLYCSKDWDYDRVHDWLRIAVQCKVQIIVLRFPPERYIFRFFWDLFKTCNTLVELSLEGQFQLDVPEGKPKVLFPHLKKISLLSNNFCRKSVENLITGCPVLEELCIERHNHYDDLKTIKVSSKTLKRLRIYFTFVVDFDCKVLIDAPRLEYLDIKDEVCSDFFFRKKPLSLVEAHIATNTISIAQIVRNISAAKVLTLTFPTLREFRRVDEVDEVDEFDDIDEVDGIDEIGEADEIGEVDDLNVPIFPNLIKLVIGIKDSTGSWNDLLGYLNNMPKLEHITFLNLPPFDLNQDPPLEAPACLRFGVKEIILRNQETITQRELAFIEFMLEHSNNLEKVTMNVRENDSKTREKLLNSYRGSKRCQIEFVQASCGNFHIQRWF